VTVGFSTLLYEVSDGVATLTLNRPERHNAFNIAMARELCEAWTQIKRDPAVICAIVTGAARRLLHRVRRGRGRRGRNRGRDGPCVRRLAVDQAHRDPQPLLETRDHRGERHGERRRVCTSSPTAIW
jgi:1,4-dihydroxy-2-naphthoyl-CoA synthase